MASPTNEAVIRNAGVSTATVSRVLNGFPHVSPRAPRLNPPLTTVAQPTYELGQKAAERLLARLAPPRHS